MFARIKRLNRTSLSVAAALLLAGLSLGLAFTRRAVLGPAIDGPRSVSAWEVTLTASGPLREGAEIRVVPPPDFRHQHIFGQHFQSGQLIARTTKSGKKSQQRFAWRQPGPGAGGHVELSYAIHCLLGMRGPTAHMKRRTQDLDNAPGAAKDARTLKPSRDIQSNDPKIADFARAHIGEGQLPAAQVRALFDAVVLFNPRSSHNRQSALGCLKNSSGDSGGRSRLLVALCRSLGIHARLLTGLVLDHDGDVAEHYWAEAWVDGRWLPMCPTHRHFDTPEMPNNYLVLHIGDGTFFRSHGLEYGFTARSLHDPADLGGRAPSALRAFFLQLSLHALRPGEQQLVRILLLLPLGALIVSLLRTLVGIPTFGTFGPALIGIAFLDLKALQWGLAIFVTTVLVGWVFRKGIDRFHLLQVPRTAALLTLIVLFLLGVVVAASHWGILATQVIALFPLVILTTLVERFWTLESEDGTVASFKTLLGTMLVAVTISLALAPDAVTAWMFRYPETLGLLLAVQFLLGRYTGYRLSELIRFRDLADGFEDGDGKGAKP